jgi:hypothetical protein
MDYPDRVLRAFLNDVINENWEAAHERITPTCRLIFSDEEGKPCPDTLKKIFNAKIRGFHLGRPVPVEGIPAALTEELAVDVPVGVSIQKEEEPVFERTFLIRVAREAKPGVLDSKAPWRVVPLIVREYKV